MSTSERGQVTKSAAEVYEEFFVPALFQEWAARVADAASLRPGQRVLDVACGTGVLTRAAAERVGPAGTVAGLDLNDGMLSVARRTAPHLDWRQGRAEALPYEPASFDAVVSQFGLMFFEDRRAALAEMMRVLRPGGRLAVAVWDSLEESPGYAAVTGLLQRLFGSRAADALRAPFVLGDRSALLSHFGAAGIPDTKLTTLRGTARFPSIQAWMYTDVRGWTLDEMIDDRQFASLVAEAEKELRRFVGADGSVAFDLPAHIVTATKR
jgi:SAM-dependent methyltransferase